MSPKNRDYSHSRVEDAASRDTLESLWVTGADEKDLASDSRTQPLGEGPGGSCYPAQARGAFCLHSDGQLAHTGLL